MKQQKEFLRKTALLNAIGAAFQRASIYSDSACKRVAKERLKNDLERHLRCIEKRYRLPISSDQHCRNIDKLAKQLSRIHSRVLKDRRFRIGIAQKAVNIYLKFLWCYGWIHEPPHCPLDSIVLREAGDVSTKWTLLDKIVDYRKVVRKIHQKFPGKSLSRWELEVYNKRGRSGVQQAAPGDS
jgi:hypothetical protein